MMNTRVVVLAAAIVSLVNPLVPAQAEEEGDQEQQASSAPGTQSQEELRQQAEEAERALDVLLRDMAVDYRQGELELELDTLYISDRTTNARVGTGNVVVPAIETREAGMTLIGRYGLADNLLLNLTVPYPVYTEREIDLGLVGQGRILDDELGLGDISAGLAYQLSYERGARPAVALDLDVDSDTGGDGLLGSGNWSIGGTVTMVKTIDPVVFFGGLGYTETLEQGGRDPGNEIFYLFATGFSLNDRVSVSAQVIGADVGRFEVDGEELVGSSLDSISLQLGTTALVGRNLFIEPIVNMGLTDDASDVAVGVNFVYRFEQLFPLPFFQRTDN